MLHPSHFTENICHTETDLLIIGGGSAGCMAAIQARDLQPDLNITIFEKCVVSPYRFQL